MRLTGTKVRLTLSYNPKADRQAERTNQSLETAPRKYVNQTQSNWNENFTAVEYALTDSVPTHWKTQFEKDTGRNLNSPFDFIQVISRSKNFDTSFK